MRRWKQFNYGLVPAILFSMLCTIGISTAVADEALPASAIERPEVVRGFNTYGAAMTEQNVSELRNEYGANVVRLQIHPQNYALQRNVSLDQAWDDTLDLTEQGLKEAARQGLMTVVDLHSVPIAGSKNAPAFWADDATLDTMISCWEEIVQRLAPYRDYIWGYDLLNEPHNTAELPLGASKWHSWAQQITDAIRVLDDATPIIYEASPGALPRGFIENEYIDAGEGYPVQYQGDFQLLDDDNVVYSVHWYELHDYTHQGISYSNASPVSEDWPDRMVYPGVNDGVSWDKETLRQLIQPVVDFQQKYDVPIYVGEFSAIRWAPGASQYIRDSVELFEEFGWSWTYHSYKDWHGWQLDYTDTMTSNANSASAIASEPTDRELIVKSHMSRNQFVEPLDSPRPVANLVMNGDFTKDTNSDGLADNWVRGANAQTSIVEADGNAQQVSVSASYQRGIDQEWMTVSDANRYRLQARIKVDQGQVRFWHYGVTSTYGFAGSGIVASLGQTNGAFVVKQLEFVPAPGTTKTSVRLWSDSPTQFTVDDVELIDLGPAVVVTPPITTVTVTCPADGSSAHLHFDATAGTGKLIDRTEYRIVGSSGAWTAVGPDGLTVTQPGDYLIGYRSIDSAGVVEAGKGVVVMVKAAAPRVTVLPAITGVAEIGSTLTSSAGEWDPADVTVTHQWLRNGQPMDGAANSTYEVVDADAGTALSVLVTATGSSSALTGTVESPGVLVKYDSRTSVKMDKTVGSASEPFTVTVGVVPQGGPTATGSVVLRVDGTAYTADLADGTAVFSLREHSSGVHRVLASYDGSETVAASAGHAAFVVR